MWSLGCILGELLSGKPIFPGRHHPRTSINSKRLETLISPYETLNKPLETQSKPLEALNKPLETLNETLQGNSIRCKP